MRTFSIKICGITRPEDARAVAAAGADAIGLNFYAKSPRAIDEARARTIIASLPKEILKVGLFVNVPCEEVCRMYDELSLDLIQLHGDEPPEFLASLAGRPVMKAFRAAGSAGLQSMLDYLEASRKLGCLPRMVLLDAPISDGFGGSGKLADWSLAKDYLAIDGLPPLVLAGGLTSANVAEAIQTTGVVAVDTASGVELQPGIKDAAAMTKFVSAARSAGRCD